MEKDEYGTLEFDLSDADLEFAVEQLEKQMGETLYQAAWRVLKGEQERRQAAATGAPGFTIQLSAKAYETLPPDVRSRLDSGRVRR